MKKLPKSGLPKLDNYCEDVMSCDVIVGKWVRLAVERHYRDLGREKDDDFPYYFEPKAAAHFFDFAKKFSHYEGEYNGKPIIPTPWQSFVYGSIFGWLEKNRDKPTRRFREAIILIAKKHGKSLWDAVIELYGLEWDGEPAAQVYGMATSRSHASGLSYRAAEILVENSSYFTAKYNISKSFANMRISHYPSHSFITPITSKPKKLDGFNPHFYIADETKDWESDSLYNIISDGTSMRRQPLGVSTSTAGFSKYCFGYEQSKTIEKILNGVVDNDRMFVINYTIDEGDEKDWDKEYVWKKANPSYPDVLKQDYFETKVAKAKIKASEKRDFFVKHLNYFVNAEGGFIDSDKWNVCNNGRINEDILVGHSATGGLDLGWTDDFTAFVLVFPPVGDEGWKVLAWFWIPEGTLESRDNVDVIWPWIEDGWIKTTSGDATDYNIVRQDINIIASKYQIDEIAFDKWNALQFAQNLTEDGATMVEHSQSFSQMNEPIKKLEELVFSVNIDFGDNPVLAWMNSNARTISDTYGNRKFDKKNSEEKIDGMVALAMATGRATLSERGSVYDEHGIISFDI